MKILMLLLEKEYVIFCNFLRLYMFVCAVDFFFVLFFIIFKRKIFVIKMQNMFFSLRKNKIQ